MYGPPCAASFSEVLASAILCAQQRVTVDLDSIDGVLDEPSRRALCAAWDHAEARGLELVVHGWADDVDRQSDLYRD